MNVLDENITRDQAEILELWGIRCQSLSRDLAAQGIADDNVIPLLLRLKRPTFLTRDADFYEGDLAHRNYALVWLDVDRSETAYFVRRFLKDKRFKMKSQRLGKVFRVHHNGVEYWAKGRKFGEVQW